MSEEVQICCTYGYGSVSVMSIVPLYVPAHVGITYFPHMWPDIQKETENNNSSPIAPLFVNICN